MEGLWSQSQAECPSQTHPSASSGRGARPKLIPIQLSKALPSNWNVHPSPTHGTPTPVPHQNTGPSVHLCLALPAWEALLGCEPPCEGGCQAWPFASASSTSSGCTLPPPLPLPSSPLAAPQQLLGGGETRTLASIPLPKQGCLSLISPKELLQDSAEEEGGDGGGERGKEWEAGCRRQMLRQPKGKEELSRSPHLGLTEVSP